MTASAGYRYQCEIEPEFQSYEDTVEDFAKIPELLELLKKEELDKYLLRKYTADRLALYVILGSIVFDSIIEHSNDELYSRVKSAFAQFSETGIRMAEVAYPKLIEMASNEKASFLTSGNRQIQYVFPQIYGGIIENPHFVNAIAQSSRVLLMQDIRDRPRRNTELNLLLDEIARSFPSLSTNSNSQVLSLFTTMFPVVIQYAQLSSNGVKWTRRATTFGSKEQTGSFLVKLLEIKTDRYSYMLLGYLPSQPIESSPQNFPSLTAISDVDEEISQILPEGVKGSPGKRKKELELAYTIVGENEADYSVLQLEAGESHRTYVYGGITVKKRMPKLAGNVPENDEENSVNLKLNGEQEGAAKNQIKSIETQTKQENSVVPLVEYEKQITSEREQSESNSRNFKTKVSESNQSSMTEIKFSTLPTTSIMLSDYCVNCSSRKTDELIFNKAPCKHGYCARCLLSIYPRLPFNCVGIPPCNSVLEAKEIEQYYKIYLDKYPNSPLGPQISDMLNYSARSGKLSTKRNNDSSPEVALLNCNLCKRSMKPEFVFRNRCKHHYCIECLRTSNWYRSVECFVQTCFSALETEKIELFFINSPYKAEYKRNIVPQKADSSILNSPRNLSGKNTVTQPKDKTSCSLCKTLLVTSQLFKNPYCGDFFCTQCIKLAKLEGHISCPVRDCGRKLDRAAVSQLKALLEKKDPSVITAIVACCTCNHKAELTYQRNAKPDYFKCQQCKETMCFRHETLMKNCFCFCPKCIGTLKLDLRSDTKSCQNCKLYICFSCNKMIDPQKPCLCTCRLCFEKKEDRNSIICVNCRENASFCQNCQEELFDESRVKLKCGHFICISCRFEHLENLQNNSGSIKTSGKKRSNEVVEHCLICDHLAGFI